MNELQHKETLIAGAAGAFVTLAEHLQYLFDTIEFFMSRYPPDTLSLQNKHSQLQDALKTLGGLPIQLADVLRRWRHDELRVLSRMGVELELINEISVTITAVQMFFLRESIDTSPFDYDKAQYACFVISQVNKSIDD